MTVYKCILSVCLCCLMISVVSAAENSGDTNVDLIENAIIINGLSLTRDNPTAEEQKDSGDILYDDNFVDEDAIIKNVIKTHHSKKSQPNSSAEIMRDLTKTDKKWHYTRYAVKKGDSLWSISKKFNTSHRLIIKANAITKADELKPGKNILIPNRNGCSYTIRQGDTAAVLAKHFKVDQSRILAANRTGSRLHAGRTIFIPDAKMPMIAKESSSAQIARSSTVHPKIEKTALPEQQNESRQNETVAINKSSITFSWPLQGRITSGFGTRIDPFSKDKRFHNGIDISAETGTPVHAASAGTVIFSGWKGGYGNLIVIKHDNGYVTVYGHNSELKKKEGETVEKGDVVSLSGMTGAVTGAHLHFEIQKYGTPLNPLRFLK